MQDCQVGVVRRVAFDGAFSNALKHSGVGGGGGSEVMLRRVSVLRTPYRSTRPDVSVVEISFLLGGLLGDPISIFAIGL